MGIINSSEAAGYQNYNNTESGREGRAEDTSELITPCPVKGNAVETDAKGAYLDKTVFICKFSKANNTQCLERFESRFDLEEHKIDVHPVEQQYMGLNNERSAPEKLNLKVKCYGLKYVSNSAEHGTQQPKKLLGLLLAEKKITVQAAMVRNNVVNMTGETTSAHPSIYSPREPEDLRAVDPETIFNTKPERKVARLSDFCEEVSAKVRQISNDIDYVE